MKPFWEITEAEAKECLEATTWHAAITEYFRGGGFSSHFVTARRHADHDVAAQSGRRALARCCRSPRAGRSSCPQKVHDVLGPADQPDLADDLVCPATDRPRRVHRRLHGDERLGRQPRGVQLRPRRRRFDRAWPRCCGFRCSCTTCRRRTSSVPARGTPSARPTWKGPISAPARISARCTVGREPAGERQTLVPTLCVGTYGQGARRPVMYVQATISVSTSCDAGASRDCVPTRSVGTRIATLQFACVSRSAASRAARFVVFSRHESDGHDRLALACVLADGCRAVDFRPGGGR